MFRIVLGLAAAPLLFVGTDFLLAMGATLAMEAGTTATLVVIEHTGFTGLFLLGVALTVTGCALLHRALGAVPRKLDGNARAGWRIVGAGLVAGAAFFAYAVTSLCAFGCSAEDWATAMAYIAAPATLGSACVTVSIPRFPWDRVPVVA